MLAGLKEYKLFYSFLMLFVALAMLGWAVPYAIANYRLDQCSASLQSELAAMQTRIDSAKQAIERK